MVWICCPETSVANYQPTPPTTLSSEGPHYIAERARILANSMLGPVSALLCVLYFVTNKIKVNSYLYTLRRREESGSSAPGLNRGTWWRWVVNCTGRPLELRRACLRYPLEVPFYPKRPDFRKSNWLQEQLCNLSFYTLYTLCAINLLKKTPLEGEAKWGCRDDLGTNGDCRCMAWMN
jgi:hypothetical protein